mmetsp:Transcript_1155/g.2133  ORF Transcript_1155/g.2133 Transcript_1155/m.2133 type:complete len:215 (+) Transcript_1155:427-1071(+)
MNVAKSLDAGLGYLPIFRICFLCAKLFKSGTCHPFRLMVGNSREASLLLPLHSSDSVREGLRFIIRLMNEVLQVTRVIGGGQSALECHDWVAGIFTCHMTNLSKHQVLDVGPFHTQIYDISLNIHTTTSCPTLHLLCDERCQCVSHITTEQASTERHVYSVGQRCVREDDRKTTLLSQHLHLTAVARKANFVGVDGDPTTQSSHESMVNVDLLS